MPASSDALGSAPSPPPSSISRRSSAWEKSLADEELEIFVQRSDSLGGILPGDTVHRIGDMGRDLDTLYDARWPVALAHNATNDELLAI